MGMYSEVWDNYFEMLKGDKFSLKEKLQTYKKLNDGTQQIVLDI